jgi:hypothetical protein
VRNGNEGMVVQKDFCVTDGVASEPCVDVVAVLRVLRDNVVFAI